MTFWQDARPAVPRFRRRARWRPSRRLVLVALVVVLAVAVAAAVMWPDGSPTSGPAHVRRGDRARPRVIPTTWTRALPDEPAAMVADGRRGAIVVGSATVSAFAARDGRLRWRTRVGALLPVVALGGDTVLLATESAFVALDRASGGERWRTGTPETPAAVAVVAPPGTPAVAVVSTEEGGLAGLDARTGRPRWSVRQLGAIRGVPAADPVTGTVSAVWQAGEATDLRVVDAASGVVRFEHPIRSWAGSPAVARLAETRLVVVGAGSARFDGVVRAFDLADGSPRWQARVPASFQPGLVPLVDRHTVVIVDQLGNVTALDAGSGRRRWSTRTRAAEIRARPVRAGDAVLVTNLSGEVVSLDRRRGTLRARRRAAGFPVGIIVARGRVVLAQRLVRSHGMQAFRAAHLAEPARSPR